MVIKEYILSKINATSGAVRKYIYDSINELSRSELANLGFKFTTTIDDLANKRPQKIISYTNISFRLYPGKIIYSEFPLNTIPLDILVEREILDFETAKKLVDKSFE